MKKKSHKKKEVDAIISEYEKELQPEYKSLCLKIKDLIESFFSNENIKVHSITYREKSPASLKEKILREGKLYIDPLREITDLAGVRIITFLPSDIEKILSIIRLEFLVDKEHSEDKRLSTDISSFGYASVHMVVELKESRCKLAEYSRWRGLKCEIQIRTILQHAWAEIEHDIAYKSEEKIPSQIERRLASLSGLLEIADREFEQLKMEKGMIESQKETPRIISTDPSNELKKEVEELRRRIETLQDLGSKLTFKDYMNKALGFYYKGLFIDAIKSYDKAIELKPDDSIAWHNKGAALAGLGGHEEALKAYDKAIELKPDYPQAWSNKGITLGKLGRHEEALRALDKAIKLKPDDPDAWSNKGFTLRDCGKDEEALKAYDKAIKLKPDDPHAWFNKGIVLGCLRRYEEELQAYDKAIKLKPDDPDAWFSKGLTFITLSKHEEALRALDKAIKLKPDDHQAWFFKGKTLSKLGRHTEALTAYRKATEFKRDYSEAWYKIASTFSLRDNKLEALRNLKRAIELAPLYRELAIVDEDFKKLWDDPHFKKLGGMVRRGGLGHHQPSR